MRLLDGQAAPLFDTTDSEGRRLLLEDYRGTRLLLAFFRYAACPFCNLRVHELRERYDELRDRNMDVLAVFQSPASTIAKYVGKQRPPFPLIPDPGMELYEIYGVESSWGGFVAGLMRKEGYAAALKGYMPGVPDGRLNTLPADFVIDEEGIIERAFYASDISEHLALEEMAHM